MPKYSLKGRFQTVSIAVVHFTEIIYKLQITNVLIVFENRIISLQPKAIAGCETLLKRNIETILLSNTEITFVMSVLQQTDFGEVHDRNAHWLKVPLKITKLDHFGIQLVNLMTVCTDGRDIVESADKSMKVFDTGQFDFS